MDNRAEHDVQPADAQTATQVGSPTGAFRTVSYDAVFVLAGMILIRLLLLEDNEYYQARQNGHDNVDVRTGIRTETLAERMGRCCARTVDVPANPGGDGVAE